MATLAENKMQVMSIILNKETMTKAKMFKILRCTNCLVTSKLLEEPHK